VARTVKSEYTKPLYAVAGATDLAVEQLRTLPATAKAQLEVAKTQSKELQGKLTAFSVADVKELPAKAKTYAETLNGKATELYSELTVRGEKLVSKIRRQQATVEAKQQVKATVSRAKATKTTATKAVEATVEAVEDAAEKIG
jgi:hypothetical protein